MIHLIRIGLLKSCIKSFVCQKKPVFVKEKYQELNLMDEKLPKLLEHDTWQNELIKITNKQR